jgi:5-methylcytosine-specific restriction enzyme subunit McrC
LIKQCYQLLEHSQIDNVDLSLEDINVLLTSFAGKLDITPNISTGKYNLISHQYVGVISLPHSKIVIEPKTRIANLTYMLSILYNLVSWQGEYTEFGSILDWNNFVLVAFLKSVKELVTKGLKQNFKEVKENSLSIKGNIDFVKKAKENLYSLEHYCNFTDISINIIENQILKLALSRIYSINDLDKELMLELNRLEKYFTDINLPSPARINFNQISFNRLNEGYRLPISLAQMILEFSSPLFEGYTRVFPAFLVDLNRLFERYVAHHLAKSCFEYNLKYSTSHTSNNLQIDYQMHNYLDTNKQLKIIPDLVLRIEEKVLAVIDTKYKTFQSELSKDYYQIIAYCLSQNSVCGLLVYPSSEVKEENFSIKNSDIVIKSVGVTLDKGVEELNKSIERIIDLALKNGEMVN